MAARQGAAHYWAAEQTGVIGNRGYRLVVYRSNALDRRRTRALDQEISAARHALEQSAQRLAAQAFACAADAQHALERWLADEQPAWYSVTGTVGAKTHHTRPGRPRKHPAPDDVTTQWHVEITIGAIDAARRQRELERRSTFVLITTVPREELSAADLLREYKGQVHVERHFHFLKDPLFVDALFVKKPERVEALGYVLLMACLLYSLVERRARRSGVPIPSLSRRILTHPTGHEIVRHLRGLQVDRDADGHRVIAFPAPLQPTLRAILEALQMPTTVFTEAPLRNPPTLSPP